MSAKIHFRPHINNQTVLFPQRIDKDIAQNDPVRLVNSVVESLDLACLKKLYRERGRRRFRHFGKDKVTMDFAFFAIAFNIKKGLLVILQDKKCLKSRFTLALQALQNFQAKICF